MKRQTSQPFFQTLPSSPYLPAVPFFSTAHVHRKRTHPEQHKERSGQSTSYLLQKNAASPICFGKKADQKTIPAFLSELCNGVKCVILLCLYLSFLFATLHSNMLPPFPHVPTFSLEQVQMLKVLNKSDQSGCQIKQNVSILKILFKKTCCRTGMQHIAKDNIVGCGQPGYHRMRFVILIITVSCHLFLMSSFNLLSSITLNCVQKPLVPCLEDYLIFSCNWLCQCHKN